MQHAMSFCHIVRFQGSTTTFAVSHASPTFPGHSSSPFQPDRYPLSCLRPTISVWWLSCSRWLRSCRAESGVCQLHVGRNWSLPVFVGLVIFPYRNTPSATMDSEVIGSQDSVPNARKCSDTPHFIVTTFACH
ncbi:hypothetical protein CC86DRAFT_166119 [Ophiobolus disseminans]|uniref:Uncharacterized protein n=1 Tax=Ophiobolus disseminans TaxID=1469910 RepID=A0A6A7AC26_9PLEO|nr:hypothetical protein CC86DRAFT_166119 [Ophiobolus disseminans]